ncbi:MAG TPA: mechanosensitive ion channel family protein [Geothrix sp.]|uniref:mechanosensitive ion channel family protein n=1 Tax=Geothrix mesophila TaxID=2922723 RepID=UPI001FADDE26|nr:mechanosensitive ion channel family protein [Geothrix sp. SG198]HJV38275.1 mechanosensitive ion channel family protein [Geothrix sp.]
MLLTLQPLIKTEVRRFDHFMAWMDRVGWSRLEHLLMVGAACLAILWSVKLVSRAVRRAVDDGNEEVTSDAERRAETLGSVLNNTARVLAVVFFLLMSLQEFGVNIGPLVAGAGIAGVALGFGAQSLVKDVISGFFLLMENQFGVGDIISVDEKHTGTVERMTLRVTQIRDSEGKAHFIPNGSVVRVVVLSKEFARAKVEVGVGYDTDIDAAIALLTRIGKELAEAWPDRVLEPTQVLGVEDLGESAVTLRTLTKTAPAKQWEVARELRRRILMAFREAGIDIPYPQRVIHHRGVAGTGLEG